MARGRMVTHRIASDLKIHQLSDDTNRLAFTWLITFADVEGRTYGDPALVRSMIFPRRSDVTVKQVEGYIRQWVELKLVRWYEVDGDWWIEFINFKKNQPNLRGEREPKSEIPAPPPDECRQNDGELPEECRQNDGDNPAHIPVKRREEKLREEKRSEVQNGSSVPLVVAFTQKTRLSELDFTPKDKDALKDMTEAGVTPADIIAAVDALDAKGYTIRGPASIKTAALSEMRKREQGPPGGAPGYPQVLHIPAGPGEVVQ